MSEPTRCPCNAFGQFGAPCPDPRGFGRFPFLDTVGTLQIAGTSCGHRKWEVEGTSAWGPNNIYGAPPLPFNPSTKYADCYLYKTRNYTQTAYIPPTATFDPQTGAFTGYTNAVSLGVCQTWKDIYEWRRGVVGNGEEISDCFNSECKNYDDPAYHVCVWNGPLDIVRETVWTSGGKRGPEPLCPTICNYLPFYPPNENPPPDEIWGEGQFRNGFFPRSECDLNEYNKHYAKYQIRWRVRIPASGYCKVTWKERRVFYYQEPYCLNFQGCPSGACSVRWVFDKEEITERSAVMTGTCPVDQDPSKYFIASDPIEVDLGEPQKGTRIQASLQDSRFSFVPNYESNGDHRATCPDGYPPFDPTPCLPTPTVP